MQTHLHDPDWPLADRLERACAPVLGRGVGGRAYRRWERVGPWGSSLFVKDFGLQASGRRAALREFRLAERLRQRGGPTPRPWAVLEDDEGCWLILQDCGAGASLDPAEVLADAELQAEIGAAVAGLHRCGAVHGDLHLGNLLRDAQGELMWIDLRRLRFPAQVKTPDWIRDLGDLVASIEPWEGRLLHRILQGYRSEARLLAPQDRPAWSRIPLRAVHAAAMQRFREHACNLDRRAKRELQGSHPEIWREAGLRPERERFERITHDDASLKDGSRSQVRRVQGKCCAWIVKHYRLRHSSLRKSIDPRNRIGRSKAIVSLFAAESLARRGFKTARPLAAWSHPGSGSWLLMEELPDYRPLHELVIAVEGRTRARLLRDLARTLRRMHASGIAYRDLKPSNLLAKLDRDGRPDWRFIDHDRNRFGRRAVSPALARRDLAALHAGLPAEVRASERMNALRAYDPRWLRRPAWRQWVRPLLKEAAERRHRWIPRALLGAGKEELRSP